MGQQGDRINDYANSMFAFEAMPEEWIRLCTRYLESLFGKTLEGKTVIDYAFGRGNWSLAFLNIGAAKVISVDASIDNVCRFQGYCEARGLDRIEVVQANFVEQVPQFKSDFVWVYGVLHHISEVETFLTALKRCARDEKTRFYFYHYNSGSPRAFLVDSCRKLLTYESRAAFEEDAPLFVRRARLRAKDDLVAPHVAWRSERELAALLGAYGFFPHRKDIPFEHFLSGTPAVEFSPHQWLCSLAPVSTSTFVGSATSELEKELAVVANVFEALVPCLGKEERRKVAIGLFNTYFSALGDHQRIEACLTELLVYLAALLRKHPDAMKSLESDASQTVNAWKASLEGMASIGAQGNRIEQAVSRARFRI